MPQIAKSDMTLMFIILYLYTFISPIIYKSPKREGLGMVRPLRLFGPSIGLRIIAIWRRDHTSH